MKKTTFFLVFLILLIVFILVAFFNSRYQFIDDAFASILLIGTAIGGFAGLILQHNRETNMKEAEFIIGFNTTFVQTESFMKIYSYCAGHPPKDYELDPIEVLKYMDYFEPLYFLLENKVITIDKVYLLVGHRFMIVHQNEEVKKIGEAYSTEKRRYFDVVDDLYEIIKEYSDDKEKD